MLNIQNLKLSRFFWTRVTTYNERGQIKVILVKKNLFKGYTMIDEFGNKDKFLSYQDSSRILDVSTTLTKAINFANGNYKGYDRSMDEALNVELGKQGEYYKGEINKLQSSQASLQQTIALFEQQKKNSMYARIYSLRDDMKNVFTIDIHSEGYDVEYETPNQIQREYFGYTTIPVKKYYSNDSKYSGDLDYYFEMLKSKIDKSLVEQFNNLKLMYEELEKKISDLFTNFSEDKYLQVVSYKTRFIISFSNFINSSLKFYKDKDISYYSSNTSYSAGDEERESSTYCGNLIKTGRNICANLIGKYMGDLEKEQFMQETLPENLLEDQTEKPKIM